jgi:hypothetical protein
MFRFFLFFIFIFISSINICYSVYDTSITSSIIGNYSPEENLTFLITYSKTDGYSIPGINSSIGPVMWESIDLDINDDLRAVNTFDYDRDGIREAIIVMGDSLLFTFYPNGTQIWNETSTYNRGGFEVEVGDLDSDGYLDEIVVVEAQSDLSNTCSGGGSNIDIYDGYNGSLINTFSGPSYCGLKFVKIGDFDNDTYKDDLFLIDGDGDFEIYNTSNGVDWSLLGGRSDLDSTIPFTMNIKDINNDGYDDIFVNSRGQNLQSLVIYNGKNYSIMYNHGSQPRAYYLDFIDYYRDGSSNEFVVGGYGDGNGNSLRILNSSFNILKNSSSFQWGYHFNVKVFDENNDGYDDEFIAVRSKSSIYVLQTFNTSFSILNSYILGSNEVLSLDTVDMNNDSIDEIFLMTTENEVYIFDSNLSLISYYNNSGTNSGSSRGITPYLSIIDINNDSINDIVSLSQNGYIRTFQSANCFISFNDSTLYNLTWNLINYRWELEKYFSQSGLYYYNLTCQKGGYQTQVSTNQQFTITNISINQQFTITNQQSSAFPSVSFFSLILSLILTFVILY